MLGLFTALAAGYGANVRGHIALRGRTSVERKGFYAAEGGLNMGVARFANIFRGSGVPETVDFHRVATIGDRTAATDTAPVSGCNPCPPTTIPEGELFAGLYSIPYRYTVQSRALNDGSQVEAHLAGQFDIHTIPIFQFLAFIDSHLFIMPLPNMTLHGRIHTNHDMYLQPDNALRIEDKRPEIPHVQVTAAGDIYRGGRKYDGSWRCWGDVYIDKLQDTAYPYNDLDPLKMSCASTDPLPDETLMSWKGTIKRGVQNISTPDVGIINRGGGEYWDRADLRIVMRLDLPSVAIDFSQPALCPNGPGFCNGGSNSGKACTPTGGNCPSSSCNMTSLQSPPLPMIEVQQANGAQDVAKTLQLLRFMCERRGALFITDVPNNPPTPPNENAGYVENRFNYTPNFGSNDRVYRRAGEDTSGDGSINSTDRNDDVCPPGPSGATAPWYKPWSCPWPLPTPVPTSWYHDMDYRRGGFWNHRERMWMHLLNVNVRALIEWNAMNGDPLFPRHDATDGGLVFFLSVAGPNQGAAINSYGVRIFDSADLDTRNTTFPTGVSDPTGLTVVTDQGMIIEGNYNKRDKYPAAVMSDAQWLLSQGWEVPVDGYENDQKSVFDLSRGTRDVPSLDFPGGSSRASFSSSSALTINAAMLFGLGPSTLDPTWYNGGLENFPRFLEGWDGKTLNYRGSFVSLGEPQHKEAVWACGSGTSCFDGVYDPPVRAFDYDPDFNKVEWLPPMTPKVVYVQQILYTRIYN